MTAKSGSEIRWGLILGATIVALAVLGSTVAVAATFTFVLRPFYIPTGGMEDTLLIGDSILVGRVDANALRRGDIVAFQYPIDRRNSFIKRIVAVGGDRVRLRDKKLWLNGQEQIEPFAVHKLDYFDTFRDNFPQEPNIRLPDQWHLELNQHTVNGELVVPPGKLFVLGDNRDSSLDSRYWGFIDPSDIIGKPKMIYFSADREQGNVRWSRVFKKL